MDFFLQVCKSISLAVYQELARAMTGKIPKVAPAHSVPPSPEGLHLLSPELAHVEKEREDKKKRVETDPIFQKRITRPCQIALCSLLKKHACSDRLCKSICLARSEQWERSSCVQGGTSLRFGSQASL